jgi:hypothetical protein
MGSFLVDLSDYATTIAAGRTSNVAGSAPDSAPKRYGWTGTTHQVFDPFLLHCFDWVILISQHW